MTGTICIPAWLFAWFHGNDCGMSSRTIAAAIYPEFTPALRYGPCIPSDPSDVGRCVRLLELAEKHGQSFDMDVVALRFPVWRPLVARWPDIVAAYRADVAAEAEWSKARWTRKDGKRRKSPSNLARPQSATIKLLDGLRGRK